MASQDDKSLQSFMRHENQHLLAVHAEDEHETTEEHDERQRQEALRNLEQIARDFERPIWYKSGPFIWFVVASTVAPVGIVILLVTMSDRDTPLGLAFALGMVCCMVGSCYLYTLSKMRSELVDSYAANVSKRMYTKRLKHDIKNMERMNDHLMSSKDRFFDSNQQTKELVNALRVMNVDKLENMNASMQKAQKLYRKWAASLLEKERSMLQTLFDRFEFLDEEAGMTKTEYHAFLAWLPAGYRPRITRLGSFDKLAKGDGIIDFMDFKEALDLFAEMEVAGDDILFQIEQVETGVDEKGNKTFKSKIVKKAVGAKDAVKGKLFT